MNGRAAGPLLLAWLCACTETRAVLAPGGGERDAAADRQLGPASISDAGGAAASVDGSSDRLDASEPEADDASSDAAMDASPYARVVTMAGFAGECRVVEGAAPQARFGSPAGITVGPDGAVYVADARSATVRRIDPRGWVERYAGTASDTPTQRDGPDGFGSFGPTLSGLGFDAGGTLYALDSGDLRMIAKDRSIRTIARGLVSGQGGLAVAPSGDVWVSDFEGHAIRWVSADGTVELRAGTGIPGHLNGPGATAQLNGPAGLALTADGTLYFADHGSNRLRAIAPDGRVRDVAGNGTMATRNGNGATASLDMPWGLALAPGGELWVSERMGNTLRVLAPNGDLRTVAGDGSDGSDDGAPSNARFSGPSYVATGADGSVYVSDALNCSVRALLPGVEAPLDADLTRPCWDAPAHDPALATSSSARRSHHAGARCTEGCHEPGGESALAFAAAGTVCSDLACAQLAPAGTQVFAVGGSTLEVDACGNFYAALGTLATSLARSAPRVMGSTTAHAMKKPLDAGGASCNQAACHDGSSADTARIYLDAP